MAGHEGDDQKRVRMTLGRKEESQSDGYGKEQQS